MRVKGAKVIAVSPEKQQKKKTKKKKKKRMKERKRNLSASEKSFN